MKKLIIISLFLLGCKKVETTYLPITPSTDIFTVSDNTITNGQSIHFTLETSGKYVLTLFDTTINQVVSKEKFLGVSGDNIKKIYTTTYPQKMLYLYLTDSVGRQIKKTKITIN